MFIFLSNFFLCFFKYIKVMTYEEIIAPFVLNSNTFKIYNSLTAPLYMDTTKYNYYLKLLQVSFSNVVPNVKENMYVKDGANPAQLVAGIGVYELSTLIDQYNALNLGELEYIETTGKLKLTNNTANTISLVSNFLTSNICGFTAAQIANITAGSSVIAQNVVVIQDYNYFILSSPNFEGNTYFGKGEGNLILTNCLYTFSSALKPLQFKTWTALMPMLYQIKTDNIQYISFELKDGLGNSIDDIIGPADFSVSAQIVRQKKI